MARPRTEIDLPPAEAKFILEALYRDGHLSRKILDEYRARFGSEVQSLEARLAHLRALATGALPAAAGAAVALAAPAAARAVRKARETRKSKTADTSPERVATRKLQGRYLGLLRQIPKTMKKRFGREAIASKGKEAVVDEMQAYLDSPKKSSVNAKKK
jgi:hypothetical protein